MKKRIRFLWINLFCVLLALCGFSALTACEEKEAIYTRNADGETCTITSLGNHSDAEVYIPKEIDGLKVTAIGDRAFVDGWFLKKIVIPDGVVSIGNYAFSRCQYLEEIVIPDSVESIGEYAFEGCLHLTEIYIPDSVTSIGNTIFYACKALTISCESESLPIGWSEGWNHRGIYDMTFPTVWDCNNNDVADDGYIYTINDGLRYAIKDGFATFAEQRGNIKTASICSEILYKGESYPVTNIGTSAFRNWNTSSEIVIPNSVTTIEEEAFARGDFTKITLSNNLKTIGESAFSSCEKLTSITIPNGVTSIGNFAFSSCDSLSKIVIPSSVTSLGKGAFYECVALTEIEYNATECADIDESSGLFDYAGEQSDGIRVTIGASVKKIPARLFAPRPLNKSPKITSVIFEKVSLCESIGLAAFSDCISLERVEMSHSIKSIGRSAFSGCKNLATLFMSENVIDIGDWAFSDCESLTAVMIPSSVTSIGNGAFYHCKKLTSIAYNATACADLSYYSNNVFAAAGMESDGITVVIGASVKKIPAYLFCPNSNQCPNIVSVVFERGSTCESIGNFAFADCNNLTSIIFQGTVAQWKGIVKGNYWKSGVPATEVVCGDGTVALN